MNLAREKINAMLVQKKITEGESKLLLNALENRRRRWWQFLVNPFEILSERESLVIGLVICVLNLAVWTLRWDAKIGLVLPSAKLLIVNIIHLAITWPFMAALLWGMTLVVARYGRYRDFLAVVGVSRLPFIVSTFFATHIVSSVPNIEPGQMPEFSSMPVSFLLFMVIFLIAIPWWFGWIVVGYKTASGLSGLKLVIALICTLALSVVVTSIADKWFRTFAGQQTKSELASVSHAGYLDLDFTNDSGPLPKKLEGSPTCDWRPPAYECSTNLNYDQGQYAWTPSVASPQNNFEIEAQIRVLTPSSRGNFSLYFAKKGVGGGRTQWISTAIEVFPDVPQVFLNYSDGTADHYILEKRGEPAVNKFGTNQLRVRVLGRSVEYYINGKQITVVDSPIALSGTVHVALGGNIRLQIEQLSVREISPVR